MVRVIEEIINNISFRSIKFDHKNIAGIALHVIEDSFLLIFLEKNRFCTKQYLIGNN